MARQNKPQIMQQYGVRQWNGVVFAFSSREEAEAYLEEKGHANRALVVHEGVPGQTIDEWTPWTEVEG